MALGERLTAVVFLSITLALFFSYPYQTMFEDKVAKAMDYTRGAEMALFSLTVSIPFIFLIIPFSDTNVGEWLSYGAVVGLSSMSIYEIIQVSILGSLKEICISRILIFTMIVLINFLGIGLFNEGKKRGDVGTLGFITMLFLLVTSFIFCLSYFNVLYKSVSCTPFL